MANININSLCRIYIRTIQPQVHPGTEAFQLVIAHDVIHGVNMVLVLIVLLTAYFAKLSRTSTWYGALSTVSASAVANLLIIGRQSNVPPSFGLCLVQASLIHSDVVL